MVFGGVLLALEPPEKRISTLDQHFKFHQPRAFWFIQSTSKDFTAFVSVTLALMILFTVLFESCSKKEQICRHLWKVLRQLIIENHLKVRSASSFRETLLQRSCIITSSVVLLIVSATIYVNLTKTEEFKYLLAFATLLLVFQNVWTICIAKKL